MLGIKRRLEKSNPGAVLDEASVKIVAIPQTQFDATVFVFRDKNGKEKFVAEACADRPDLPHIYCGKAVNQKAKGSAAVLVWAVAQIGFRILHDPRFNRGNIIQINGFAGARA